MSDRERQIEDEILVLGSMAGDRESFQALVRRWQEPLWRHAFRLLRREDAAWDVIQDTWMHVAGRISRIEDPAAFRSWVYTIASRRAMDWHRARGRDAAALPTSEPEAADERPSDATMSLRNAISKLDDSQRIILSLRHLEGFGVGEIAAILDIPEGTVKSRLHYARERLKTILEKEP